jgi:DNA repair exonuclease SbcCD ATPase subunit
VPSVVVGIDRSKRGEIAMNKKILRFNKVSISRMPGLENGLKAYEGLSSQINIIAGPNASGKSSTARAIQQLIWLDESDRIVANGEFTIDQEKWTSFIDYSSRQTLKNGNVTELKGIPAPGEKSRYMLSLHELIREEEGDLAENIQRDAIGGYDIDQAKRNLNYSSSKSSRRLSEFSKYEEARKISETIASEQRSLQKEQKELMELREQRENAQKAKQLSGFFELVLNYKEKLQERNSTENELKSFPEVLDSAKEGDFDQTETLERDIDALENKITEINENISLLKERLEDLKLPENGVDPAELKELVNLTDELAEKESFITKQKRKIAEESKIRENAAETLGLESKEDGYSELGLSEVKLTEQFWSEAFDVYGEIRWRESVRRELESEKKETEKSDVLQNGIESLSRWLRVAGGELMRVSPLYLMLTLISAIGTAAAVQFAGGIGYAGILFVILFLFLAYRSQESDDETKISIRQKDFTETGLKNPESWDVEGVSERLRELSNELQEAEWQEKIEDLIRDYQSKIEEKNIELDKIHEQTESLREKIGVLPGIDTGKLKDYSSLYWFFHNAAKWHDSHQAIIAMEESIKAEEKEIEDLLGKINGLLKTYQLKEADSYAAAKALAESLGEKREKFNELTRDLDQAEKDAGRINQEKEKTENNLKKIYARLNVDDGEKFKVKELTDKLEKYNSLKIELMTAEQHVMKARDMMKDHPYYGEFEDTLEDLKTDEISTKIANYKLQADRFQEVNDTIVAIETKVGEAKRQHELETALAKKQEALENLEVKYRENASSIVGDLLADQLQSHLGEKNMPEVFREAQNMFRKVTRGRYELSVSGTSKPGFRAVDHLDGKNRSLDELSTGTRIQLIMSVRLAFIGQAEDEIKLPILADELLANSDSQRADAIIDALVEISREGRQIFYFTAQEDEVAKWKQKLEDEADIDHQVFVIEQGGDLYNMDMQQGEIFEGIRLYNEIPEPDGLSYEEYGKVMGVREVNHVFAPVEQLHIWYLFDETERLFNVLKTGIENWGMLKSYLKDVSVIEGFDNSEVRRLEQRASLVKRYLELARHGRNRPIDRQVLEDSGAVSDTFIDEVAEKLPGCNYDPEKLLEIIGSEVSGFRNHKLEELEEYLISEGYIQNAEPLSSKEIRIKLLAHISKLEIDRDDAEKVIERFMK